MITIIFGQPGVGKTALMTSFAIEHMTILASEDLSVCKGLVKRLNNGGYNLTMPKKHLVFADYTINIKKDWLPRKISNEIDGFFLGLPNSEHPVSFLPPGAQIYLDEAQKYYNSRMSKYLPDFVSRFYETHRHNHFNITLACQHSGLIDLNVRELAGRLIEVLSLEYYYDKYKNLVKTVWTCKEFDSGFDVESYIKSNKTVEAGRTVKYVYHGDIFSSFNSYGFFALYYKDRLNDNFNIFQSCSVGYDVDSIEQYNTLHGFEVPDTYYKKVGR